MEYLGLMIQGTALADQGSGPDVTEATLIFNAKAGGSARASPDHLVGALQAIGYSPVYRATEDEVDLTATLLNARGTVFVAGGDGTVRAAALRLAGRTDVRLALIPLGTANNIARTLGIEGEPLDVIAAYARAQSVLLDLGRVTAPWGTDLFLEACGCGIFADILARYHPEEGKSLWRAAGAVAAAANFDPLPLALTLDGQVEPEAPYALVEVINYSRLKSQVCNYTPSQFPQRRL